MRRFALFPVLVLPFLVAALPAASLLGGSRPATETPTFVVLNDAPGANAQFGDAARAERASDPVAYGIAFPASVECHVSSTVAIEG